MLVEAAHAPIPSNINIICDYGDEIIVYENRKISGTVTVLEGSEEAFIDWLKSFDGVWITESPMTGRWEVVHIKPSLHTTEEPEPEPVVSPTTDEIVMLQRATRIQEPPPPEVVAKAWDELQKKVKPTPWYIHLIWMFLPEHEILDKDYYVWTYVRLGDNVYGLQKTCWKRLSAGDYNRAFGVTAD